jgi:hypothetical protein
VILGELLWKLQITQMIAQCGLRMLAAVCLNVRFLRCAAPNFTLLQHFARRERTQHEFVTSALGSLLPFAAFARQKNLADTLGVRFLRAAL